MLHEPGKVGGEGRVEAAGIDVTGDALKDLGAAGWRVAGGSIKVTRSEPPQDAGPMQKIVHQRIDGDHDGSGFGPENASRVSCQQETGERHRQHLVRDSVGVGERFDDSLSQPRCSIGRRSKVGISEPSVDPANKIAVGDIAHEQEQAVCRLVEPAVAQIVGRQRAIREMVRLSAAPLGLLIPAMVEVPVTLQLRA